MSSEHVSKAVFQGLFPLTAQFRSGPRNPKPSYDLWLESQPFPGGNSVDLQTNVLRFAPENYLFANKYAKEHPETLILSTWRAASGQPKDATTEGDPLGISPIEFPGHWVQSLGTTLASSLEKTSEIITVSSGDNMVKGPALLVQMTSNGGRRWDKYEYVLIKAVNGNKLTVKRSYNGGPSPQDFPKSTHIAPLPWDNRNREEYTDWFFNLSEDCPRDANNMTAMDVLFKEMVEPLAPGGPLDHIGGLDLASGPLTVNPENADYDLDGEADSSSVYRKGVDMFYHRLRDVLGFDRILTTSLDYDHLDMINGVNQEGLAYPNDPWEAVSKTVNEVLAWKTLSNLTWASIAFVQYLDREEDLLYVQMHRLLNGYSACLGLAADVDLGDGIDALTRAELFKGDENEPHWLGRSMGMTRVAASTPNVLGGASGPTDWDAMIGNMNTKRATLEIDGDELVFVPTGTGSGFPTLELTFPLRDKSDFTVFFDAKSDDDQLERSIYLPRVSVDVDTKPVRAFVTGRDYIPVSFYVRGAEGSPNSPNVTIDFRFDYGGPVRFRSMSVHTAPDTLACEFEGGAVLVNPSLEGAEFDLLDLFGKERTGFQRITMSEPNEDIEEKYQPQLYQALEMNNGEIVSDVRSVEVGPRNALFLIANQVDAPGGGGDQGGNNQFCQDSTDKFEIKENIWVDCVWVQRKRTSKRCQKLNMRGETVEDLCPGTCGQC